MRSDHSLYLFDTHALVFWAKKQCVSDTFIRYFDEQVDKGNVIVSSISFWEIALLTQKNKIKINDVNQWRIELLKNTNIQLIHPTASEMIDSTLLENIHKDPFDRLLIVQANNKNAIIVTKDKLIADYAVNTYWV